MTDLPALDHPRTATMMPDEDGSDQAMMHASMIFSKRDASPDERLGALGDAILAEAAERSKERKTKKETAAANRKLIRWVVRGLVAVAVPGAPVGAWAVITADPEVQASEVQESVEERAAELEVMIKGDGNGNGGLRGVVEGNVEKLEWLHTEVESQQLQSYELAKMLADKIDATSPKAARVSETALDTAEAKATEIKDSRAKKKKQATNPFED